jgi:hypothetical protein
MNYGGFLSETDWIFLSGNGTGFRSTRDGGATWHTTRITGSPHLDAQSIVFSSVTRGWAREYCTHTSGEPACTAGMSTVVLATRDGGRTWSPVGQATPPSTPPPAPAPGEAGWIQAGSMRGGGYVRPSGFGATVLDDGRVLVVGNGPGSDLYDPATGGWTTGAAPQHERYGQFVVKLLDGRVLMAGGQYDEGDHSTAEIYDPVRNAWSWAPPMREKRTWGSAVTLRDGRVLVIGGGVAATSSELFDPALSRWTHVASPPGLLRSGIGPPVLLRDGRVLVVGGDLDGGRASAQAAIFDPARGTWTKARRMIDGRSAPSTALLPDGRVLVVGGARSFAGRPLASAEVYDPVRDAWAKVASPSIAPAEAAMTSLEDGRILIAGGYGYAGYASDPLASAEIYDPTTDTWVAAPSMHEARFGHAAVRLEDGSVLVIGGHAFGFFHYLASAERYYPDGVPAS